MVLFFFLDASNSTYSLMIFHVMRWRVWWWHKCCMLCVCFILHCPGGVKYLYGNNNLLWCFFCSFFSPVFHHPFGPNRLLFVCFFWTFLRCFLIWWLVYQNIWMSIYAAFSNDFRGGSPGWFRLEVLRPTLHCCSHWGCGLLNAIFVSKCSLKEASYFFNRSSKWDNYL